MGEVWQRMTRRGFFHAMGLPFQDIVETYLLKDKILRSPYFSSFFGELTLSEHHDFMSCKKLGREKMMRNYRTRV